MKFVNNSLLAVTAACFFAFAGVACDNTARGVKQDAAEAKDEAKDASAATKDATKDAADATKDATRDAVDATKAATRDTVDGAKKTAASAGGAINAATETLDVKAALMGDASVDASDINVDTYNDTKTVVLKGSVPTAAQKEEAGRIAAREAEGFKVNNQLVVKPRR